MNINGTFTDVHGVTHTNPIIVVTGVHYNETRVQQVDANVSELGLVSHIKRRDEVMVGLHFQALLYTNEEALAANKQPMIFKGADGTQQFTFSPEPGVTLKDAAEVVAACEQHLFKLYFTEKLNEPDITVT